MHPGHDVELYDHLGTCMQGMKFIFRLRYLFERTEYYSPLLWFAGTYVSVSWSHSQILLSSGQ